MYLVEVYLAVSAFVLATSAGVLSRWDSLEDRKLSGYIIWPVRCYAMIAFIVGMSMWVIAFLMLALIWSLGRALILPFTLVRTAHSRHS